VLVVAIGEATKLIEYLLGADKRYLAEVTLGGVSDTFDGEGVIRKVGSRKVGSRKEIEEVISEKFVGEIEQVPPAYSAIKVDGKRAYKLARSGEAVAMKARRVRVDEIVVAGYAWPSLRVRVTCGKGTYIRSLARQIGEGLGTGGYLTALRRTAIGQYTIEQAVGLEDLPEPMGMGDLRAVPGGAGDAG